MPIDRIPISLPRNAFSVRDVARAGDIWRAFQDAAVAGSTARGWPPSRFVEEGCAFVVREMTVQHDQAVHFGDQLDAETWVERFRRETFTTRQVRFHREGARVASATQEWVHVSMGPDGMRASRATGALLSDFPEHPNEPLTVLPPVTEPRQGPDHRLVFDVWYTTMDPLGHANHPAYVDWCDELVSQTLAHHDLDPVGLVSVAERVRFKRAVVPGSRVEVTGAVVGTDATGNVVVDFSICVEGRVCATARTHRGHVDGAAVLLDILKKEAMTWPS